MRKILFIFSIGLFLFNSSFSQNIVLGGTRIISPDAGFEITFPAGYLIPRRDIQKDKTITFTTENGKGTCIVAYARIKKLPLSERSVKNILEDVLSNYLRADAKIISASDVWIDSFRGKSVKFLDTRDTAILYNRFDCYVYGDVVLQIAFIGNSETEAAMEYVETFFNSLSLINTQFNNKAAKFTSEDSTYSIFLPKGYDKQVEKVSQTDSIITKSPISIFPMKKLKGAVLLSTKTCPDSLFKNKNSYQVLEEAMIGMLNQKRILLLSGQFILKDEYPGISFTGASKNEDTTLFLRSEYYLKEHQLYQVGYAGYSREEINSEEILAYFRSFEIKK